MPETDYRKLFELYLFENRLVRKAVADDEAAAILAGLSIPDNTNDQQKKTNRKIEPGGIYCHVGEDCCLEYLVLEQNNGTWLVLKISGWIDFADQYDLIFSHDDEPKMIQLRNAAFVLPDKIEQSLYLGNAGGDILKQIKTTLLEKDRVAEDSSGAELPLKWRFFQQRFHSIEADQMQQYLHHDWKNQPLPVPLPLPESLCKQEAAPKSTLDIMRSCTHGLDSLDKGALEWYTYLHAENRLLLATAIDPKYVWYNALSTALIKSIRKFLSGSVPNSVQRISKIVENHGISILYTSPWALIWPALKDTTWNGFSYYKVPSGDIILKINPILVGKEAQIKIKDKVVFDGALKPVFSLGSDITDSENDLSDSIKIKVSQ
ncbi:MAG: hypothetical protein GX466_02010 [Candidatus Cloacimonetes bacterium]|nr:hypothetical protein [Candidatus Cloacimonadota bacterium]